MEMPELSWRDGDVPVSERFGDPYFSLGNGLEETRHVFLDGNALPARLRDGIHVAELGFGTGLNLLALWHLWRASGLTGTLHFTSFEAFPLTAPAMARAHAAFPQLAREGADLLALYRPGRAVRTDGLHLEIITGDAGQTLPRWQGRADAWFLDGFSPARNPEMWTADLMQAVASHTAPAGTFATYTAAGHVRRALAQAGFDVARTAGYGSKRHMSKGVLR